MPLAKSRSSAADVALNVAAQDMTSLLADLAATESGVRRNAVRALGLHPGSAAALCDRLQVETSPSVRAVLFTTLIRLQSPAVAVRLAKLLRSDDAPLRNAAIEALQEMPDAVAPHLQTLLADEDSDVRIFTVNILAALRHRQAPEWLAVVVRGDPHVNVCAAAVDGLAEIGGPETVQDLRDLRGRFAGNAYMEFAIDTAIRRIGAE
ncbi:MAG TPA: HEAT repeat domain-containing protein [Patescibacteria group bacterium]|nr:HEAT repeat domain-containing protein [Patescibacteria group bacterium]